MSCPFQNLSQIGGYLNDVRKRNRIQFLLDGNGTGYNDYVRNFSRSFQRLTVEELVNEAGTVARNLMRTMLTRVQQDYYMTRQREYFELLMFQYLSQRARAGGLPDSAQHHPWFVQRKYDLIGSLSDIGPE